VSPVYPDEKLERSQELPALPPSDQADQVNPAEQDKPSYTDFFMAMAFLSSTRSKDKNYQLYLPQIKPIKSIQPSKISRLILIFSWQWHFCHPQGVKTRIAVLGHVL
jgi:hypothetical protein